MHKINIIGVSGQAGAGKDLVASHLVQRHDFCQIALADPIKRFTQKVFGFTVDQLWGPSSHRNAVDKRFKHNNPKDGSDAHWQNAGQKLKYYGKIFVADLLQTDNKELINQHYSSLVHWFYWLSSNYESNISPRIVLQTLGTEWGRNEVSQDIWVNYLIHIARKVLYEDGDMSPHSYDRTVGVVSQNVFYKGIVVSDVRFPNEFELIKYEGGAVIRINRAATDKDARTMGIANHASETEQEAFDNFDFMVKNDGTIDELLSNIDIFMKIFEVQHAGAWTLPLMMLSLGYVKFNLFWLFLFLWHLCHL